MREKIHQRLIELRLNGMQEVVDRELAAAEKKGTATAKVLYRLLCEELAYRQERSMHYRINHAKIPWDWTLKTFPFDKQPGVKKSQIMLPGQVLQCSRPSGRTVCLSGRSIHP
jgi:DNA replication protein DnaC